MPQPAEVTPLEQHTAHDAQHGIAAKPDLLWDFWNWTYEKDSDGTAVTANTLINYGFMDGTENQKKAVRSTVETKLKPPGVAFDTWEDYANVKFRHINQGSSIPMQVRITFKVLNKPKQFDSAVGMGALDFPRDQATMKLIGIADKYPPTKEDRGVILHEFGHVLGLDHEHQSPTLEGYLKAQLDAGRIIKDFRGDEATARSQVINKVRDPTNYTRFDKDSIMVYDIESFWQEGLWNKLFGKSISATNKLSEIDKAFVQLMYPPDLSKVEKRPRFLKAMQTAGVPSMIAGEILKEFVQNKGGLVKQLEAVRRKFNLLEQESFRLFNPNRPDWLRAIDPMALKQSGVTGFVGDVTKNKLFQAIVKNVVYRTMEQSGTPTKVSVPGSTQNEVMRMLGALAMHDSVAQSVKYYDLQLGKRSDVNVPPIVTDQTDRTPDEVTETPHDVVVLKPDLHEWKKAPGSAIARIKKGANQSEIDVELRSPLRILAVLTSTKESINFKGQKIDARGVLYYNDEDQIPTSNKAKWTLDWVVFYRDTWERKNFTACLIPIPTDSGSVTSLVSAEEGFRNVRWESTK